MTTLIVAAAVLINSINVILLLRRVTRLERALRLVADFALPEDRA